MGESNIVKVVDLLIEKISTLEWQLERAADEKKLMAFQIEQYQKMVEELSAAKEASGNAQSKDL